MEEKIKKILYPAEEKYDKEKAFDIIVDIGLTRSNFEKVLKQRKLTKQKLLNIVLPFSEKYNIDSEKALKIIRDPLSVKQAYQLAIKLSKK